MTMLNYDPTRGASTPRLPSEGPGTTARGQFVAGAPVPGLGSATTPSFSQAYRLFSGAAAPQLATIEAQQAHSRAQIAALQAQYAQAQGNYGQNIGFANRGYNLGLQSIDLARQGVQRNDDYYNNVLNLLTNHTNADLDELRRIQELTSQDYQGAYGYQQVLEDLARQVLGLQTNDREVTRFADDRNQRGEAAARGAFSTPGNAMRLGDIQTHFDTDIGLFRNAFDTKKAGLDETRRALTNQYNQTMERYRGQAEDIQYGFEREQASLWREQDANADQRQALDLKAQELGLTRDQTIASLSQGLQNMQLQNTININDLTAAMTSGDIQRQIVAQQVMNQALQIAGPPPPPPNPDYQSGGGSYVQRGRAF